MCMPVVPRRFDIDYPAELQKICDGLKLLLLTQSLLILTYMLVVVQVQEISVQCIEVRSEHFNYRLDYN